MKKFFRHWFEINCRDQIKIWFSHTVFVFRINRLLICYSWILLMTSSVNSSTNQKPIITLSAQSLRRKGTVETENTLIFQGKTTGFFFFFLYWVFLLFYFFSACQHIDFTDTSTVSQRLIWFINVQKLSL